MRKARVLVPPLVALLAAAAGAQDDPAEAHIKLYKKVAPSVVFVAGGSERGSGVIIDKDGYVLTSPTACGQTSGEVTVLLRGHKRHVAKVVGRVNDLELVVLKVPGGDLPAVELGDSDKAKIGSVTYVFGDSFQSIETDDQVAISIGVLSATYELKSIQKGTKALYKGTVLETSCAVNPNQDGGALVDAQGRLLGILTLNYDDSKFTGVAVPINRLRPEIERIIREHRTGVVAKPPPPEPVEKPVSKEEPGWLGADVAEDDDAAGLLITRLFKNGPAEKGGLKKGDVIRQVNKQRVMTFKRFDETMQKLQAGASVTFRVRREGKDVDVTVTLGKKNFY